MLVALLVVSSGLGLFQWLILGRLAEQVVLEARVAMVRRLFRVRLGELSGQANGDLVTRVTSDTVLLREAATSSGIEFFTGIVTIIGSLVLMATLDWVLLATTLATLIVVSVAVGSMMPPLAATQRRAQDALGRLGGVLGGALRAIRTVKSSRAEERQSARILAEVRESARQRLRAVRIEAVTWTVAGAGFQVAILCILGLGAWRVETGALTVSGLVAYLLYAFLIVDPVTRLTQTTSLLQSGIAAAARIREVQSMAVEETEPTPDPRPVAAGSGIGPLLSFRGVSARYAPGVPPALHDVTVDILRVGHIAVVGPSGAGKTTLFSLMLRFLEPERGELTLDGVPLRQYPLDEVRRRIVYVEQDTPLLPGTLRGNLLFTWPEADEAAIWRALAAVQLQDRARSLPQGLDTSLSAAEFSGGERQRIALARALVTYPEMLLLDEATAQLDGLTEAAVHDAIVRVARQGAVVTIAHRLSTVVEADRIIVLENGTCRAAGTHTELLRSDGLYADLVAALRIANSTRRFSRS